MDRNVTRREFIHTAGACITAVGAGTALSATGNASAAQPMPQIKLGALTVSRLILGSNQFFGYSHMSRKRDQAMREHFTDERIMEMLDEAASHGITSASMLPSQRWYALWKKYSADGGRMSTWISQPMGKTDTDMIRDIEDSVQNGAKAIYIQGNQVERRFNNGEGDLIRSWVERIRKCGVAAGLASHQPHILPECEKRGYGADFYFQCCYIPDNFKSVERDRAMAAIAQLPKPVIAYKVMAAGRNQPDEAFEFVFKHLRTGDGVCVGAFPKDKPGIIAENASLVLKYSER
jgi:hypothetical protein